jgi:hypothetical protein
MSPRAGRVQQNLASAENQTPTPQSSSPWPVLGRPWLYKLVHSAVNSSLVISNNLSNLFSVAIDTGVMVSIVGIVTGYMAGRPMGRSSSLVRVKNFFFYMLSRPALGSTQPPIHWVPWALSPGVKRQGRQADHSPPTSAEFRKILIYASTPRYAFMA